MQLRRDSIVALVLGSALMFAPALSHGQEAAEEPAAAATAQVDEATLEKFALAFAEVRDIQQQFSRELETVESQQAAQSLQQKTQAKMLETVKANGLTVEQYNGIVSQMDQDPELRSKVMGMSSDGSR